MSTNAANVRVGVSGAIYAGDLDSAAPTGTSGAPPGLVDLGYVSEDGVEITIPGAGDSTALKAWQNSETVRTITTPSDDLPTWHFTLIETKLEVIEIYFDVEVTQTATEGSFEYVVKNRSRRRYVIDYIDGAELKRDWVPYGMVTDLGSITASNGGDPIGYEITISGERDPSVGFNFKEWATALGTSASSNGNGNGEGEPDE